MELLFILITQLIVIGILIYFKVKFDTTLFSMKKDILDSFQEKSEDTFVEIKKIILLSHNKQIEELKKIETLVISNSQEIQSDISLGNKQITSDNEKVISLSHNKQIEELKKIETLVTNNFKEIKSDIYSGNKQIKLENEKIFSLVGGGFTTSQENLLKIIDKVQQKNEHVFIETRKIISLSHNKQIEEFKKIETLVINNSKEIKDEVEKLNSEFNLDELYKNE